MSTAARETLSTADLAAAGDRRAARNEDDRDDQGRDRAESTVRKPDSHTGVDDERLAPLFLPDRARDFRARWDAIQIGFVDDPKRAVRDGDELVAQVMKSLAESFAEERSKLEQELGQTDKGSTENLRVALRRYRSFFQRLLSL